ncbi:hypothetical protein BD413DRAFT_546607 [Trametes elegans]|nr:hypothetical protein BD413DRAFT_546607 [Trametes elegans]
MLSERFCRVSRSDGATPFPAPCGSSGGPTSAHNHPSRPHHTRRCCPGFPLPCTLAL